MDDVPLSAQLATLVILLLLSGLFSLAETVMMTASRYRLRHLAKGGNQSAATALGLLSETEKFLGAILLGNNLFNAAAATLVSLITIHLLGEEKWALGAGTFAVTFAILIFSEITPKIVGASNADRLAIPVAYALPPLLKFTYPAVWFVNLFVSQLLRLLHLSPKKEQDEESELIPEELRTLVQESSRLLPRQHQKIFSNLFELNDICVEEIMTPRRAIEILDLAQPWEDVKAQLITSHHSRLPVCMESLDHLIGVLPVRRMVSGNSRNEIDEANLRSQLLPPYYIPAGTLVFNQLTFFQENRQRIGFVVDEYGDIQGLLTLENIIEEIVGEFTSSLAGLGPSLLSWDDNNSTVVEGARPLRDINRSLGLKFPVDGPKTLNGLILEHFQDIPEAGVSLKICSIPMEIIQTRGRAVITARLFRPQRRV